jgi:UDP-glucose 4-epimerase/UDP-glucuronate decarboxylase
MARAALITGGTGFIGAHLARTLVAEGVRVTLVDNGFRSRRDAAIEEILRLGQAEVIDCDLTRAEEFAKVGGPYDEVYHLAAIVGVRYANERPAEVLRANVLATINLVDWLPASGLKRVLLASTSEVYAATVDRGLAPVPTPEDVLLSVGDGSVPRYSYGLSKIVSEMLVRESARRDGYEQTTVRFHNIYGPRMGYEHVVPQVLERIARREAPFAVYGARQKRAFCYVDDAVTSVLDLMRSPRAAGRLVNVGNDQEEIEIRDLVRLLFEITGYNAEVEERPAPQGSVDRRCPDLSLLRDLIGDRRPTPLRQGLATTAAWYRDHARTAA